MFPLSNIKKEIFDRIELNTKRKSELTSWVRVMSGAKYGNFNGLILQSNTNHNLLRAAGQTSTSIYGDSQSSGIIGIDWLGNIVEISSKRDLRPSPVITGLNIKEGDDGLTRGATLQMTAFSLEQMEALQTFFLEPGYNVFIEWGFNTDSGIGGLVDLSSRDTTKIADDISKKVVDFRKLIETRELKFGEYDAILGFVIGGSVSNEGENFNITVELQGAPSISTAIQGYQRLKQKNPETQIVQDSEKAVELFSTEDEESGKSQTSNDSSEPVIDSSVRRRFAYMFNDLPTIRQTRSVKNLIKTCRPNQFVNFDMKITKKIINGSNLLFGIDNEVTVADVDFYKEDLFSENRYIRMDLAVDILNEVGSVDAIVIGEKEVPFKISIDDSIIGGFPYIFSCNPSKLLIPGEVPDFFQYFLKSSTVSQLPNGSLLVNGKKVEPYNPDKTLLDFLGKKPLPPEGEEETFEYKERELYYGYLKNLFVNFDLFKKNLEKKNKNTREIFYDILNEMSSAVNGFWNFQIKDDTDQNGNVILKVVDKNWIGEIPDRIGEIKDFRHIGFGSTFLEASLDISIPDEKANQIIMNRLDTTSSPDSPYLAKNGIFESTLDLFTKRKEVNADVVSPSPPIDSDPTIDGLNNKIAEYDISNTGQGVFVSFNGERIGKINTSVLTNPNRDSDFNPIRILEDDSNTPALRTFVDTVNQRNDLLKTKQETETQNVSNYLDKIDVVPKSNLTDISFQDGDNVFPSKIKDSYLTNDELMKENFAIYCFRDTDFLDTLKESFLASKYGTNEKEGLSAPLPIVYSFTIIGNSGIKRGDVFNVDGIPRKYKQRGVFQVTQVEHSLSGNDWKTTITAQYRQKQ